MEKFNIVRGNDCVLYLFKECTSLLYQFALKKNVLPEVPRFFRKSLRYDSDDDFQHSQYRFYELYLAFRQSDIPPHQTGWGNIPSPSDLSLSAYIENFHEMRKSYYSLGCETLHECYEIVNELHQFMHDFVMYYMAECSMHHLHETTCRHYGTFMSYFCPDYDDYYYFYESKKLQDIPVHIPGGSRRIQCGGQAIFNANLKNNLEASQFVWQRVENKNVKPIDFSEKKFRIGLENSLIINNVDKDDNGVYQLKIITQRKEVFLSNRVILRVSPIIKDVLEKEPKKGMMKSQEHTGRLAVPIEELPTHKDHVLRERINRDKDFLRSMSPLNFVKTKACMAAKKFIKMHQCTIITGRRGDGKTTVGYQCLKNLVEEGMKPLILWRPKELYDIPHNDNLAIFMDDIIETNNLFPNSIQKLVLGIESVITRKQSKSVGENKYIFVIQKDCLCYIRYFLKEDWQMQSTIDISLFQESVNDKIDMLKLYAPDGPDIKGIANTKEFIYGFPECCNLFGKDPHEKRSFFDTTCKVLEKHLKKMTGSYFIVLAALSVRGGKIHQDAILDQNAERLFCKDIAVSCSVQYDESFLCSLMSFSDTFLSIYVSFDTETNVIHFHNDIVRKMVTKMVFDLNPVYLIKSCNINCLPLLASRKPDAILQKGEVDKYIPFVIERLEALFKSSSSDEAVKVITEIDLWHDSYFKRIIGEKLFHYLKRLQEPMKLAFLKNIWVNRNGTLLSFIMEWCAKDKCAILPPRFRERLEDLDLAGTIAPNPSPRETIMCIIQQDLICDFMVNIQKQGKLSTDEKDSNIEKESLEYHLTQCIKMCAMKGILDMLPFEELIVQSSVQVFPASFINPIFRNEIEMPDDLLTSIVSLIIKSGDRLLVSILKLEIQKRLKQKYKKTYGSICVWAGYSNTENISSFDTIVIVLKRNQNTRALTSEKKYLGLDLIVRNETEVNDESLSVMEHEHCTDELFSFHISADSMKKLLNEHSNITYISVSNVRSRGHRNGQMRINKFPCIVIYVHVKGVIPFGEKPFPTEVEGKGLDIREGVWCFASDSTRYGDKIKCTIGDHTETGTLGGIVYDKKRKGFITCAHVVCKNNELQESETLNSNVKGREVFKTIRDEKGKEQSMLLGRVEFAIFHQSHPEYHGIDAALVYLEENIQVSGEFSQHLSDAELRKQTDFKSCKENIQFWNGQLSFVNEGNYNNTILKVGAKTGMTVGTIFATNTYIQHKKTRYGDFVPVMSKCVEIRPKIGSKPFFDFGDSGSLIFMVEEKDPPLLKCIGMGFACNDLKSCFMTPIENVLKGLRLDPDCFATFENPFNMIVEKDSNDNHADMSKALSDILNNQHSQTEILKNQQQHMQILMNAIQNNTENLKQLSIRVEKIEQKTDN